MAASTETPMSTNACPVSPSKVSGTTEVIEVAPMQVEQMLRSGEAVLVDVREPDEHARERIDGAVLVPLSKFDPAQIAALTQQGRTVVLHCRGGRRSADACRMALALPSGSSLRVLSMSGGIEAWKAAKLPVTLSAGAPVISIMRQVQIVVGFFVLAGVALGYFVHPAFLGTTVFFGAGLLLAGVTNTCALAAILGKMPWNRIASSTSCSTPTR